MLKFSVLFLTSRKAMIEVEDFGIWNTNEPYEIWLNGEKYMESDRATQTIKNLKPDTDYEIQIKSKNDSSEITVIHTDYEFVTLDVKRFQAVGDGIHDDTAAIQAAIMACPAQSRVWIPKGIYKVSSLFLKSNICIDLDDETVLSGTIDRKMIPVLPGMIQSYDEEKEYNLGSWEGNPLDCFASMITGIGVSNVVITGGGVLDGNAANDNWWEDDRAKIIAFRPRMIFLNHCENVTVHGLTVQNSPSWNLHPYFSRKIRFLDLTILNPWDSPNTDGMDPESVNGLEVIGVHFSLGDDCIAVKSGKYYMGHKYKEPSQNLEIRQCYMENGHGAVSIGSEMAGGVRNLHASKCIFKNTDRGLRIKTRRGRGKDATIEGICFEDIQMEDVRTPFVVNCFYNCCDPDCHSEYVKCKSPLPVDERTPAVNHLVFKNIECSHCHAAGAFLYGLPEQKIDYVEMENIHVDYASDPVPMEPAMMDDLGETCKLGLYINNADTLVMNHVTVEGNEGEAFDFHSIDHLIVDGEEKGAIR